MTLFVCHISLLILWDDANGDDINMIIPFRYCMRINRVYMNTNDSKYRTIFICMHFQWRGRGSNIEGGTGIF